MKIFKAQKQAITSKGFRKAFFYSFGSFLVAWGLAYIITPEATHLFKEIGWLVPLLNTLLVYLKQSFDANKTI